MFTVLIPFRNGYETLGRLLDSLPDDLPILIVDDRSDPPLRVDTDDIERAHVRVLRLNDRGYFSGAVNAGMAAIDGDALILNQDVWLDGEAWRAWIAQQIAAGYGAFGHGQMKHPAWPAGYIQGQFMFVTRAAWDATGPFNARDYPLWGATAEWQVRAARRGIKVNPVASVPGLNHARAQGVAFGASIAAALDDEPAKREWMIRTPPLVSVIITSKSYGRYLPDAIASLVGGETSLGAHPGQTLQSFEAIIVDDGSKDETAEVGRALADPMKAIRYIRRNESGGTPAANNTGIRASYGHFITILCADDMREPGSLEALYRVVDADPKAVAYDDILEFAHGKRAQHRQLGEYGFPSLVKKNMMHAGIMFHRRAFDETGGYHESMREGREDWQFNVALGLRGYCGRRVPQFGYLYRREGQNRSLTNAGREWFEAFRGQLRGIFGTGVIDQGVYPMGCCGGGQQSAPANGGGGEGFYSSMVHPEEMGTQGMVNLRYLGGNAGEEDWYGAPPARRRYKFGGSRVTGFVDARDVQYLTSLREHRRQIFEIEPDGDGQAGGIEPAIAQADAKGAAARIAADFASLQPADDPNGVAFIDVSAGADLPADAPAADGLLQDDPGEAVDLPPTDFNLPIRAPDGWVDGDPRNLTVKDALALLPSTTADQRAKMRAMETEGQGRVSLLAAIDKAEAE